MIGSLLALASAVVFALNNIFIRRAVVKVSAAGIGALISVPMALLFFFLILLLSGRFDTIFRFSWRGYVWLSLAGIFHFGIGRTLLYNCIQLVGANIASILRRFNVLVSVVLGVVVLHEPLSWNLAVGVLLIVSGITLAGLTPQMFREPNRPFVGIPVRAYVLGLGCGLIIGITPIFVKLGLEDAKLPIGAAFISFLAATVFLSFSLVSHKRRNSAARISGRAAGLFAVEGFLSSSGNLTRYLALSLAPASVVMPIISSAPVFLLIFSFLFNRRLEIFSKPVIIGTLMVVAGNVLLI